MSSVDLNNYIKTLEFVPCNLCGNSDRWKMQVLHEKERFGLALNTVICLNCGLVFINPRPSKELYGEFYKSDYRKVVSGSDDGSEKAFRKQIHFMESYVIPVVDPILKTAAIESILDVGCSYGGISLALKKQYGAARCDGIEPVVKIAEFARLQASMNVHPGLFEDFAAETEYDLVCFSRALNHTLDPNSNLRKIASLLKPGGYLLITLYDGFSNLIYRPFSRVAELTHPYIFCEETIKNMLTACGFEVVCKRTNTLHGKHLSEKDIPLLDMRQMIFLARKAGTASERPQAQSNGVDVGRLLERIQCNMAFFEENKSSIYYYWNSGSLQARLCKKLLRLKKDYIGSGSR